MGKEKTSVLHYSKLSNHSINRAYLTFGLDFSHIPTQSEIITRYKELSKHFKNTSTAKKSLDPAFQLLLDLIKGDDAFLHEEKMQPKFESLILDINLLSQKLSLKYSLSDLHTRYIFRDTSSLKPNENEDTLKTELTDLHKTQDKNEFWKTWLKLDLFWIDGLQTCY